MRIGELAALAGVSTRTVRHYHHLGLLPEPRRLANGYRVYGLRDAVALARVRRLTELGLGLDEVRDVLADDAGRELPEVLAELDADLARQEEALRARRARLGVLLRQAEEAGGLPAEGPVSEELAALFGEMARASAARPGPEPAMAAQERELLALIDSTAPPEARARLHAMLGEAAAAPGAIERAYEVYALLEELADAEPDDPRVAVAARAVSAWMPDEVVAQISASSVTAASAGEDAFARAYFAEFAPAQAEAIRQAMALIAERAR
ncbi:MerR family transcriptional regulator [Streptomyces sp. SAJ15]|uniref:MerR family transcriptional regulator n=1 Tax=Streptomyces sp. SAJ15 TaxID=2011095 RepID=UPI0011872A98|nr:MerR family transcriptional regulator [Streptomyces sp. SAJ15]TVL89979.1 MerR family transcriptional regulator [Streptomyces sp. SAJ15]